MRSCRGVLASVWMACTAAAVPTGIVLAADDPQLNLKARAAGGYFAAADLMIRLKASRCGYIVKKPPPSAVDRAREIEAAFDPAEGREVRTFLSSSEYQRKLARNQDLIDGALHQYIDVELMDTKTACGMLVGTIAPLVKAAELRWRRRTAK